MPAPRGVELDKRRLAAVDHGVEVRRIQDNLCRGGGRARGGDGGGRAHGGSERARHPHAMTCASLRAAPWAAVEGCREGDREGCRRSAGGCEGSWRWSKFDGRLPVGRGDPPVEGSEILLHSPPKERQ